VTEDSVVQFPTGGKRIQIDPDAHLASYLVVAGGCFSWGKTYGTYRLYLHYTAFHDDMVTNKHKDVFTFTLLDNFQMCWGLQKAGQQV